MSKVFKYTSIKDVPVIISPAEFRNSALPDSQEESSEEPEVSIEELQKEIKKNLSEMQDTLKKAKVEAEEILEQACREAETVKQEAYDAGHELGYKEGLEKGENDIYDKMKGLIEDAAQKAQRLIELAGHQTKEMIIDANDQIVDIITAAVKKALCQELLATPGVVVEIVKEALDKVREHEQIVIRVNPEDFELVLEAKHQLQKIIGREHDLSLVADKTIACGGCFIDTSDGAVDARLDTRLELLTKTLLDVKKIEDSANV